MHYQPIQDSPKLSQKELQMLRSVLLTTVYQQTITQLQLFQRGQRLNATHYAITKASINRQHKTRKTSTTQKPKTAKLTTMPATTATATPTTTQTQTPLATTATTAKANKSGAANHEDVKNNDYCDEYLPSEKVLNAIKLEQELDALKQIYRVAIATLTADLSSNKSAIGSQKLQLPLRTAIEAQKVNHNEDEVLQQQLRAGQATMRALKTQLDTAQQQATTKLHERDEQIATLKHNLRHVKRVNELELNLVERWEETRFTQSTIVDANEERSLLRQILDYKRQLAGEERIICEIEAFRNGQFVELRQQIYEWQNKFRNEIKRTNLQLQQQEKQMIELTKTHERHAEIYAERVEFVKEYLAKKAEEEAILKQQLYRVECAVHIQAWWRGTMVRRGLGPYKKKPKKGKKSKAK